jgi:hypothetical protein
MSSFRCRVTRRESGSRRRRAYATHFNGTELFYVEVGEGGSSAPEKCYSPECAEELSSDVCLDQSKRDVEV